MTTTVLSHNGYNARIFKTAAGGWCVITNATIYSGYASGYASQDEAIAAARRFIGMNVEDNYRSDECSRITTGNTQTELSEAEVLRAAVSYALRHPEEGMAWLHNWSEGCQEEVAELNAILALPPLERNMRLQGITHVREADGTLRAIC